MFKGITLAADSCKTCLTVKDVFNDSYEHGLTHKGCTGYKVV